MTFEETIRESIRKFYKGKGLSEYMKENDFKYTKDFFDNAEEKLLGKSEVKETKDGRK
tara:strand:- start:142 stop:315 length:174 start_codon:yes stop_codon:yes gene_type:complete